MDLKSDQKGKSVKPASTIFKQTQPTAKIMNRNQRKTPPWPSTGRNIYSRITPPWPSIGEGTSFKESKSEKKTESSAVRGVESGLKNFAKVAKSGETSAKNQGQVYSNKGYNPKPGERSKTKADWKEADSQARYRAMSKDKWKEVHRQERLRKNLKDFNSRQLSLIKDPVDLTDFRKQHILNRHKAGACLPEKTEFPKSWNEDRILHNISDSATDPKGKFYPDKWGERTIYGKRDGVVMKTNLYGPNSKHNGKITTSYPINVPKNPKFSKKAPANVSANPPKVKTVKNTTSDIVDNIPQTKTVTNATTDMAENAVKSGALPKLGKAAKIGGKALGVVGTAMDVKELYDSYQADGGKIGENTVTSAGGIAGGWAGATVGAKGGAMGGAAIGTLICPGVGTAIGSVIGGLAGGIFGGLGGRWAGEKLADAAYN